jgi:protein-S-isoprenylcysteine O-methyltransferase Ste14
MEIQKESIRMVRIALEIVSMRLLTILAMGMSFLLACWAMWIPSWERMAMAGFFAVCVFLPCISWEWRKSNEAEHQERK